MSVFRGSCSNCPHGGKRLGHRRCWDGAVGPRTLNSRVHRGPSGVLAPGLACLLLQVIDLSKLVGRDLATARGGTHELFCHCPVRRVAGDNRRVHVRARLGILPEGI